MPQLSEEGRTVVTPDHVVACRKSNDGRRDYIGIGTIDHRPDEITHNGHHPSQLGKDMIRLHIDEPRQRIRLLMVDHVAQCRIQPDSSTRHIQSSSSCIEVSPMTDTCISDEIEFDPFSEEFFRNPHDIYQRLRTQAPVHFNPAYGLWALSRYVDVAPGMKDFATFSSTEGITLDMALNPGQPKPATPIALDALLDVMPEYTVDRPGLRRATTTNVAGWANVPVPIA